MRTALHWCSGTAMLLLLLSLLLAGSAAATGTSLFVWKPSEISIETTSATSGNVATFAIRVTANRTIAQPEIDSDGTLAAHILATSQDGVVYEGTSGCFSTYSQPESIAAIVASTALSGGKQLADLAAVRAQTYGRHASDYDRTIVLEVDSWMTGAAIDIAMNTSACAELVTVARWNDPSQWDVEEVPNELADVVLPPGAGRIQLDGDIQIASLRMEGGTLLMHRTDCQPGWSPGSYVFNGLKCYRRVEERKTYEAAQSFCVDRYPVGNSLMRPVTDEQLILSRRLCRGDPLGCWIGVRAQAGKGFNWVAPLGESEQPRLLRGWARREPRNFTVDGHEEACVMISAFGTEMPTGDELHTWKSARCDEERAFICERAARTTRFTLAVSNGVHIAAGALRGAGVLKVNNSLVAEGDSFEFSDAVTVLLGPGTSGEWRTRVTTLSSGARVELQEGSSLAMGAAVQLFGWGDDKASTTPGAPPELVTHPGSSLVLEPGIGQTTHLNAYCSIAGSMQVASSRVSNNVGGNFAHAHIELPSVAEFVVAGGAALLQTDGVLDLTLRSTTRTAGPDFSADAPPGVYRLAIKSDAGVWTPTECIAFNATADELRSAIVDAGGGSWLSLLVRKVGEGLEGDQFAISYQIEYDHSLDGLPLVIECGGGQDACGCSNLTVEAEMLLGTPACTGESWVRSASTDPLSCAKIPDVRLQPRVVHGRAQLTGAGKLAVQEGMHRLPATASVPMLVDSGVAVIFAANISATKITVAHNGTLFVAGAGAAGYDAVTLTFAPPDVPFRSIPEYLAASTFSGSVGKLQILGNGKLLTPVREAQLHVRNLTMTEGIIGGRISMAVDAALFDGAATKQLRYGANVTCLPDGAMTWTDGDLTMAEGSAIHIAGTMDVNVQNRTMGLESTRPTEVLRVVQRAPYVIAPLPAAVLDDYSSSSLEDPILGWYFNPLCAPHCETLPLLHVAATGTLLFHNRTRATWNGELSVDGELFVVDQSEVAAQGVGAASSTAKVEVATGSVLDFRADMAFAEVTTVTGQGVIAVSGPGSLVMPAAMNCTLVVNGGEARFTRASHSVRDVVLQDGVVAVPSEAYETTVSVERDFNMSQGLFKLPRNLNRETDPDNPYVVHRLNVHHNMDWTGGRIFGSGVVNVAAGARMFLGGESTTLGPDTRISNAGVATMGPHTQLYIESGSGIDYLGDGSIEAYTVDQVGNLFKAGAEGTDWAPHSWD